jgi:opacity protein-like surface antigen
MKYIYTTLMSITLLMFTTGHAFSEPSSYMKITVSDSELNADNFSFHNPTGAGFTNNAVSGSYIIMTSIEDESSNNAVTFAYGRHIMGIRTELSYTMREEATFKGNASFSGTQFLQEMTVDSDDIMLTGYIDHDLTPSTSLSLGLGVGMAFNDANGLQGRNIAGGTGFFPANDDNEMAYSVSAGIATHIHPKAIIELSYTYKDLGDVQTGTTDATFSSVGMNASERLEGELQDESLGLSLRVIF